MQPRNVLGVCLLLCLVVLSVGCRDRFECGIRIDGTVTRCTGNTEVCLCSQNRCARTDPEACPDSGYAYVFPEGNDEKCVPEEILEAPVIASEVVGDSALCPNQSAIPPRCGLRVSGEVAACPGNQTCLCDLNLCASFERTEDCPEGWRRAVDGVCLDVTTFNPNIRVGTDGLCPGATAPGPRISCGRPNEIGLVEECPDDQVCICGTNRCAIADAAACPATRFRYAPDAADDPAECVAVEDAEGERVDSGACADFRPARIPCGTATGTTSPDCPDPAQRCVCASGFCAEDPDEGQNCTTGLRFVGSGECVDDAELATTIDAGLCAPGCGVLGDDGRIVQCPFGSCVCGLGRGQCAVPDATCPTGSAFVETDSCVTYTAATPAQTLVSGVCPANPVDEPCGVVDADGRLTRCPDAGEMCVCQNGDGRCARVEMTCPNDRAFVPTNRCAPADSAEVTTVVGVLCPGVPMPPGITCGELDGSGRIRTCAAEEQCICRPSGGTCAQTESACPFGLSNSNDGTCVALSTTDYTRPVSGDALCPPFAPTPVSCGVSIESECGAEPQCGCRTDGTGVCVVVQGACASGLAEAETLRCIRLDENLDVRSAGACPAPGGP